MCVCVLLNCVSCFCPHSAMEPEWRAKALEAEHHGKLGHRPGFYHCGGQCLYHSVWSPQAEAQWLTKNTHRYPFYFCKSHTFFISTLFLCSPLSLKTDIFYPALLCSLPLLTSMLSACFWSSPLLTWPSQSPTWPTNTLTSPGYQRNFYQKTTKTKSNHCSFTRNVLSCTAGRHREKTVNKRETVTK